MSIEMSAKAKDLLLSNYKNFFMEVYEIMNDEYYSDDYRIFLISRLIDMECEDGETSLASRICFLSNLIDDGSEVPA